MEYTYSKTQHAENENCLWQRGHSRVLRHLDNNFKKISQKNCGEETFSSFLLTMMSNDLCVGLTLYEHDALLFFPSCCCGCILIFFYY